MLKHNKGKLALVTGGGSGVGFAIAEKLTANGVTTIIVGRNKEKLDCATKKLGNHCKSMAFDSEFQQVMHLNVSASFALSREVSKGMLQNGAVLSLISVVWLQNMAFRE
jgi:short-subunit dehydrogenase